MAREIHMVSSRLTDLCFLRFNLNLYLSNGQLWKFHHYLISMYNIFEFYTYVLVMTTDINLKQRTKQGKTVTAIGGFKICHFSEKKKAMVNDKADKLLVIFYSYLLSILLVSVHMWLDIISCFVVQHDLENEEANSSSTPAEICIEKLGYIPGHLKGRSASKRNILANESLQRELQLEKEKTKKLQIHINKIEKKHNKMEKKHNNLKQKVDYLMKHLPHLSGWQSQVHYLKILFM